MLKGFKEFIMRGNVVELAVGVVIGAAFNGLVTQFTKSFLDPLLKLLAGGEQFSGQWTVNEDVRFDWSGFVNAIISFLLTAAALYFLIVFPMNKLAERRRRGVEPEPTAPSDEVRLLTDIRDTLQAQGAQAGPVGQGGQSGPGGYGAPGARGQAAAPGTQPRGGLPAEQVYPPQPRREM